MHVQGSLLGAPGATTQGAGKPPTGRKGIKARRRSAASGEEPDQEHDLDDQRIVVTQQTAQLVRTAMSAILSYCIFVTCCCLHQGAPPDHCVVCSFTATLPLQRGSRCRPLGRLELTLSGASSPSRSPCRGVPLRSCAGCGAQKRGAC